MPSDADAPPPEEARTVPVDAAMAPRRERADAARNRQRVLAAAERLFAAGDPRTVTMEDIARAAGVGRATLYRRYPDPAAVAAALLDEHERDLQEQLLRGAPPLGPGAPPAERLAAFYEAMTRLLHQHLPLVLGAETGPARYRTGAYQFWRAHVRVLLTDAGITDSEALIEPLLAPLAPDVFRHQCHDLGQTPAQIASGLRWLAHRTIGTPSSRV